MEKILGTRGGLYFLLAAGTDKIGRPLGRVFGLVEKDYLAEAEPVDAIVARGYWTEGATPEDEALLEGLLPA